MTSFRVKLATFLGVMATGWLILMLLFYIFVLWLMANTSGTSSGSTGPVTFLIIALTFFVMAFFIFGLPSWVLFAISRVLLRWEEKHIIKTQEIVNIASYDNLYAKQNIGINGDSVEKYLQLQITKNVHPVFEPGLLTPLTEHDEQTERIHDISDVPQYVKLISEPLANNSTQEKARIKSGYVYLIQSDRGYYKIGMTKNIDDRMATFHVKLPFEPDLIHVIECEDRRAMEKSLHIKFAAKRINGEWFDLTGTDVAFIKSIKKA